MRLPGYGFTVGCDRVAGQVRSAASGISSTVRLAAQNGDAPYSPSSLSPG